MNQRVFHEIKVVIKLQYIIMIHLIIKEWEALSNSKGFNLKNIDELSEDQNLLNFDKKWKALFLYVYGYKNSKNLEHFPELNLLINKWESEITLVFFSSLEANKYIPPHQGSNFGVLRVQFGIDIKNPTKSALKVGNDIIHLQNNENFIFDDTFTHEAWNYGDSDRVLLIVDIKKKYPYIYNILNEIYLKSIKKSSYVKSVIFNLKIK